MEELRAGLLEAAERDVEANRTRTRRRRRRAAGAIVAILLGGAAAATAADLISVGEPLTEERAVEPPHRPSAAGSVRPEVSAASGDPKLPYAVGTYIANNGDRCALAGHTSRGVVGTVRDGVFRPYRERTGVCGKPGRNTFTSLAYDGRSLVFGITGSESSVVRVTGTGVEQRVGTERPFLFVFDGGLPPSGYEVTFD